MQKVSKTARLQEDEGTTHFMSILKNCVPFFFDRNRSKMKRPANGTIWPTWKRCSGMVEGVIGRGVSSWWQGERAGRQTLNA